MKHLKMTSVAFLAAGIMALITACSMDVPHEHTFATEWTTNETHHWHAATCEHITEVSGKAEHSFGEWNITKQPTEEAKGLKEKSCSVCGYKVTEEIAKLEHTHKFAEAWTADATHHWHAAICGHTTEVSGKAEHTFGEWSITKQPTEEAEGARERTCSVCGYKAIDTVAKLDHVHAKGTHHDAVAGTCVTKGTLEYYDCVKATCEVKLDADGKPLATIEGVLNPSNHTGTATTLTKTATTHKETYNCCGAVKTPEAAHTFGEWKSNNNATTQADGTKTRICSDCKYEETVTDVGTRIVETPVFSVASGDVNSGTSVTLTCATEGAKIFYTTDGSEPTASSTEYTAAISITAAVTVKAIAIKDGMNNSAVATASYTIKGTVATPVFSITSGAVESGTSVTITCTTEGAKIYYTTDGSEPTSSSIEYTVAISVTPPVTIKAIAVKDGLNNSAVATASYTVKGTVAMPVFSIKSGIVESGTSVTISCTTDGAKIYYTTDGSEPTSSSTEYTAAISITAAVTIKAIAVKEGMNNSAFASASYTVKETVATPTFSVASEEVDSGTSVAISCATEGAKIYYTTDGSVPTAASTEYTAAITVTEAVTIKAIAVKDGMNDSAVASASYTIKDPDYSKCVVGDFILKDGTVLSKDSTPQSGTVAAVIVRAAADGKPALGVGIVHNGSGLVWCTSDASGHQTNINLQGDRTSGYMDGSNSWDLLVAACDDLKNASAETFETVAEKYPAFNYCRQYGKKNELTGDLANGWYLPTVAELYTISQNKTVVNTSLSKAGGSQFGTDFYWSCCQNPSTNNSARGLNFSTGNMFYYIKSLNYNYVCSVRAFK